MFCAGVAYGIFSGACQASLVSTKPERGMAAEYPSPLVGEGQGRGGCGRCPALNCRAVRALGRA
jgi:hypothetical protein